MPRLSQTVIDLLLAAEITKGMAAIAGVRAVSVSRQRCELNAAHHTPKARPNRVRCDRRLPGAETIVQRQQRMSVVGTIIASLY